MDLGKKVITGAGFIATVFDERQTIIPFIESLLKQGCLPSESVIVDGGSTDGTFEIIKDYLEDVLGKGKSIEKRDGYIVYEKKAPGGTICFKLVKSKGANISQGRNIAIGENSRDMICVSDAGCILDKDWLYEVSKKVLDKTYEVAGGITLAICGSILERALACCVIRKNAEIDIRSFMPSSRNVCFKKKVYEEAGRYPEDMDYGEDMRFDFNIRKNKTVIGLIPEAKVYWRMRKDLLSIYKQFFRYAKGDAIGGMYPLRHAIRFSSFVLLIGLILLCVFISPYFLFGLLPLAIFYLYKPASRNSFIHRMCPAAKKAPSILAVFFVLLFLVPYIDMAKASGYIYGLLSRKN